MQMMQYGEIVVILLRAHVHLQSVTLVQISNVLAVINLSMFGFWWVHIDFDFHPGNVAQSHVTICSQAVTFDLSITCSILGAVSGPCWCWITNCVNIHNTNVR